MSKLMKIRLRKELKQLDKDLLIKEILNLFSNFKAVQEHYQIRYGNVGQSILDSYKSKIRKEYFPDKGFGHARSSVARGAINEFRRLKPQIDELVDLLLFKVENGVKFTNEYGDIDEPFYNSMESSYEQALKLIAEHNLFEKFQERCKKVVTDTDGIGWGFHDGLSYNYYDHYGRAEKNKSSAN